MKYIQVLHAENCKILLKENKADLNKWRNNSWWWIRRSSIIVNSSKFNPYNTHSCNQNPSKLFFKYWHTDRIAYRKDKRLLIATTMLKNLKKAGGHPLPNAKSYYKVTEVKEAWYWFQNRNIDQWHREDIPEIEPQKYN